MKLRVPTAAGVRAQRRRHLERSRVYRAAFALAGFALVLGGIALLVLPGPGLLLIVVGLGMLALEFRWAERAFTYSLDRLHRASASVKNKRAERKKRKARDEPREEPV